MFGGPRWWEQPVREAAVFKTKSRKPRGMWTVWAPCGRGADWRGPRSVIRLGRTVVTYRSCLRRSTAAWATAAALLVAGADTGLLLVLGLWR